MKIKIDEQFIIDDFKRRINSDNYKKGQYGQLSSRSDTLLTNDWYPESPYELNPEKVEEFIKKVIHLCR